MSNIAIRHINRNLFDVFYGPEGWEDWARFRTDGNGRLHPVICHKQLPEKVMSELRGIVKTQR